MNTIENNNNRILSSGINGRVDITGNYNKNDKMNLFTEKNNGIRECNTQSLSHMYEGTNLQNAFFSKKNINEIQKLLKYHVSKQTEGRHIIGNQDVNQLLIIMKSIYLQHGHNTNSNVDKQVRRLNAFLLEYSVKNIILNIEQYNTYKRNVSTLPKPLPLPKYISAAGTRTNPNTIY